MLYNSTVISADDGLLRTSTGCAGPSSSSTLYTDWLRFTVTTTQTIICIQDVNAYFLFLANFIIDLLLVDYVCELNFQQ